MVLQDTEEEKTQGLKGENDVKKEDGIGVSLLEAKQGLESSRDGWNWAGSILVASGEKFLGIYDLKSSSICVNVL